MRHRVLGFLVGLLSRVPLCLLYALARSVYVLAFYMTRYRRHVIEPQIDRVFPALDVAARRQIHRQFIRNYCDVMVEILKSFTMTAKSLRARVRIRNVDVARRYLDAGQSVMLVTSHLCNWEWLLQGVTLQLSFPVDAAYKPLPDQSGERLMFDMRSRFGATLIPAKDLLAEVLRRRSIVRAIAVNADQAPAASERHQWLSFLGRDTAFYVGAEQIARAVRLPMIYLSMRRVRRGHYDVQLRELWDGRELTTSGALTARYASACELDVLASPADWLWTYRRWRFPKPLYGADST
jgi:Kdo2-lipid IVA lauroyltransferase/acyltransferase